MHGLGLTNCSVPPNTYHPAFAEKSEGGGGGGGRSPARGRALSEEAWGRSQVLPPSVAPMCCPQVLPPSVAPTCCPQVLPPCVAPGDRTVETPTCAQGRTDNSKGRTCFLLSVAQAKEEKLPRDVPNPFATSRNSIGLIQDERTFRMPRGRSQKLHGNPILARPAGLLRGDTEGG